jgi:hypothetical protein
VAPGIYPKFKPYYHQKKKKSTKRAGSEAQVVERLPTTLEALGSKPNIEKAKK